MSPSYRTHRKRFSSLRLSSDTTSTLPEYVTVGCHREDELPSDQPPDYPDSAEEADEDTDSDNPPVVYVPPPPLLLPTTPTSPRRIRRFGSHKRKRSQASSSHDPFLDSLLERSVHALEMSNTLLQSSMATQSSLSAILSSDSHMDQTLETSVHGLSMRIQDVGNTQATWEGELDEITRGVEGLFEEQGGRGRIVHGPHQFFSSETSVSRSLPSTSSLPQPPRHRRRPSLLDFHQAKTSQLSIPHQNRPDLTTPVQRGPKQYALSAPDSDTITLPSTLSLRNGSFAHLPLEGSQVDLRSLPSPPKLTERPLEPSTPAYNMLSSFVKRAPCSDSSAPSPRLHRSFLSRNTSPITERNDQSRKSSPSRSRKSPENVRSDVPLPDRSSSLSPRQIMSSLPHRPMTPPAEESSNSSDGCPAKLTVISLRKILDEQPVPPPVPPERLLRAPAFLPRTPTTIAEAGTSTTTASVSRLLTKSKHSSSTRPPSPPRQSAMKQPSPAITPSPSTHTIPDLLGARFGVLKGWWVAGEGGGGLGSSTPGSSGSGRSTPKRISFAELPESYADSKLDRGGSSSRFGNGGRDRKKRGKVGRGGKGKGKGGESDDGGGGWWSSWLAGAGAIRNEERTEDRLTRGWGGRMGGMGFNPGFDEWAV